MIATCSAFSDKCMNYRNEEINSIWLLEMSVACDEKLWGDGQNIWIQLYLQLCILSQEQHV